jgi:protocatechuate 3,4-dioxygenase beta subunit
MAFFRTLGRFLRRKAAPKVQKTSHRRRRLSFEGLENRQLLTLVGILPNFPLTFYNSTGQFNYQTSTEALDMTATPLAFMASAASTPTPITGPANVAIHALVDHSGNLVGGNGNPDFQMSGSVDANGDGIADYTGTLLTGKILQFGYQYNSGTSTAQFDFRFLCTGGSMSLLFAGMDIGVAMASENSNSFTGSFQTDFNGGAKGTVGPVSPLPTSIHGYKFNDINGNGVDNSDPRLSGWTINLTGTDSTGTAVSTSTTTGANGEYSFTGLTPGTYTISETQQTGWTKSLGGTQVTLTSGQEVVAYTGEAGNLLPGQTEVVTAGLAFGNFEQTSIHGYKFNDLNGNGVDNSDPRLNAWTINLTGTDNTGAVVSKSTTTGSNGEYSFTGLTPGIYTISETQQTGWTKSVGGTQVTLTSGQEAVANTGEAGNLLPGQAEVVTAGLAFGNFEQTSIHGYKFNDLNGNGVDNSEPRLGAWTINLTGTDNTGSAVLKSTTTDANGEYSFTALTPGTYTISETQQTGWTKSLGGTQVTLTSGQEAVANSGEAGNLLPGQVEVVTAGLAFGNFEQTSIHGYKFNDLDGNGADNSEPRLSAWTINLTGTDNTGSAVSKSTTTDANGEYSFTDLTPGTYTISETQQTGWTKSVGGTQVALTSGQEAVAYSGEAGNLLPGQTEVVTAGLAFGNFEQTSIHGYKFNDLNGNGIDNSDPRLSTWTINLTGTDNTGSAVSKSTTTDANGEYSFTALTPGTYTISETQQTGWTKSLGGTQVTLTSGQEAVANAGEAGNLLPGQAEVVTAGLAFGNFEQTSIHGYKFNDLNGNGVDNSDPRLSNWTIDLAGTDNTGNAVSKSTITDANGEYSFTGLTPGIYSVSETQQTNWTKSVGGAQVTLTSGQEAVAYGGEAGNLLPGQTEVITDGLAFGNFTGSGIVIGNDKSPATPQSVSIIDPSTGTELANFVPYGSTSQGGVRVATGDLTKSGVDNIVTAPGRTNLPVIKIYSQTGTLLTQFQAYPSSMNGGLQVAVADVDGDGVNDIITVPSYGPAEVRVFRNLGVVNGVPTFDAAHPYRDFLAFPSSFIGGAVVAAADMGSTVNNAFVNTLDGKAEIIVGSGAGMTATVEVFDVSALTTLTPTSRPTPVASFTPYSSSTTTFQGGVSLAVARVNADSIPDIVVGAGANGRSLVDVWAWNTSTASLASLSGGSGFAAFTDASRNAAINVATINSNGIATAILAVQGPGGTSQQVVQMDILTTSPLSLSSPAAIPGSYAGPYTIATVNSLQTGSASAAPAVSPALASSSQPSKSPRATIAGLDSTGGLWTATSTGGALSFQSWGGWNPAAGWQHVREADVNGDGKADIVGMTSSGQWWVAINSGTSFVNQAWGGWNPNAGWTNVQIADVNGDGMADIVGMTSSGQWWVALSTGASFVNQAWGGWNPNAGWTNVQIADVIGNGKADIVGMTSSGQWWVALSTGTSFVNQAWGGWNPNAGWTNVRVADVNGDGMADIVGMTSSGDWYTALSNGTGFVNQHWGNWNPNAGWSHVQIGDVNGDGKADILGMTSSGDWYAALSSGTGFVNQHWGVWNPSAGWTNVQIADFNGDGKADIVGMTASGDWYAALSSGTGFVNHYWGSWNPNAGWTNVFVGLFA